MSLSFSISFTMSHIWFCTENTCEENMLTHGFYTSPLVTDHLSLSEAQNWDILRVLSLSLSTVLHVSRQTLLLSPHAEMSWPGLPLISPPDTRGRLKINLLPVLQTSYSFDFHAHVSKLWSESSAMNWLRICSSSARLEDLLLSLRWMRLLSVGINQTGSMWLL